MTTLLFVRNDDVYLPEVSAYKAYLKKHYPEVIVTERTGLSEYNSADFDILWYFMGLDMQGNGNFVVHEYNSASTPPYAKIKNRIKKAVNAKPNQRIFLNETVKHAFKFKDDIPCHMRDMGIDIQFFNAPRPQVPDYDFIMVGGLDRGKPIYDALDHLATETPNLRTLLVGNVSVEMRKRYSAIENMTLHGRAAYEEVPSLMAKARYGLNIMPDKPPFNLQTSTKALEYCAVGLPIITTNYKWINHFEEATGARFFKLEKNFGNLNSESLSLYDPIVPNVEQFHWDIIIEKSGIFSFLD